MIKVTIEKDGEVVKTYEGSFVNVGIIANKEDGQLISVYTTGVTTVYGAYALACEMSANVSRVSGNAVLGPDDKLRF